MLIAERAPPGRRSFPDFSSERQDAARRDAEEHAPAAKDMRGRVEGDAIRENPPTRMKVIGFYVAPVGSAWLLLGLRVLGFDQHGALGGLPR